MRSWIRIRTRIKVMRIRNPGNQLDIKETDWRSPQAYGRMGLANSSLEKHKVPIVITLLLLFLVCSTCCRHKFSCLNFFNCLRKLILLEFSILLLVKAFGQSLYLLKYLHIDMPIFKDSHFFEKYRRHVFKN
jgi:hypothetical protein